MIGPAQPSAVAGSELADLPAVALVAGYRRGDISPVEVTEAARESARAAERRWCTGSPLSGLDGVPVTLKENIATRDNPTPLGSAALEPVPAAADAPAAARLSEASAVLVGTSAVTAPDSAEVVVEPGEPDDYCVGESGAAAGSGEASLAGCWGSNTTGPGAATDPPWLGSWAGSAATGSGVCPGTWVGSCPGTWAGS
jgi:aspartyl-tRNA(Asn)/glutamyl-tRNA(Gln) amidotransferase subunit A